MNFSEIKAKIRESVNYGLLILPINMIFIQLAVFTLDKPYHTVRLKSQV